MKRNKSRTINTVEIELPREIGKRLEKWLAKDAAAAGMGVEIFFAEILRRIYETRPR